MRRLCPLALLLAGCAGTDLHRDLTSFFDPAPATVGKEPSLAAAARVDQVGRAVVAANPFAGGDISFQTVGSDDPAVFHRDTFSVFITDSLVAKCKTDGELAAVLCVELGKMLAERRNAARMGVPEPIPDVPGGAASLEAGGIASDQVRVAELAMLEKKFPRKSAVAAELSDPRKLAADLLKNAGYEERDLERAEPILKAAAKESPVVRQLSGPGAAPRWTR